MGAKDPRNSKKKTNRGVWRRCKRIHLEGQPWWSKVNRNRVRARDARAISKRIRNAEEGSSKANTTIVAEIMRCKTAKEWKDIKKKVQSSGN